VGPQRVVETPSLANHVSFQQQTAPNTPPYQIMPRFRKGSYNRAQHTALSRPAKNSALFHKTFAKEAQEAQEALQQKLCNRSFATEALQQKLCNRSFATEALQQKQSAVERPSRSSLVKS